MQTGEKSIFNDLKKKKDFLHLYSLLFQTRIWDFVEQNEAPSGITTLLKHLKKKKHKNFSSANYASLQNGKDNRWHVKI